MNGRAAILAFLFAGLLFAIETPGADGSGTGARNPIQIAPQELPSALEAFGRLQGLRIVFVSEDLANLKSAGVMGSVTNEEALQALMRGTGLSFQFLDSRTVSILPSSASSGGAASAPRETPGPDAAPTSRADSSAILNELTVTSGRYALSEALKMKVFQFVNLHSARDISSSHIPRWYRPICPQVTGLSQTLDAFVTARIRQVAAAAGAPVQIYGECDHPNVEVMFTAEPQRMMDDIAARYQGVLGFPYQSQIKQRSAVTRPIQSWYATATRKLTGDRTRGAGNTWQTDRASDPDPSIITGTRLPPTLEIALTNALVVVDTRKVADHKLGSLADYTAMLVLSQANALDKCDELPTILDLMSTNCTAGSVGESITSTDAAYLKALYMRNLTHTGSTAIADVVERMYLEIEAEQRPVPQP